MKVQTLMKQRLSSPAHRLAQVFLIAALGLCVLWLIARPLPAEADPSLIYVRTDGSNTLCNGEYDVAWSAPVAPYCAVHTIRQGAISVTVGGTVIVRSGTYSQANFITQSLTLLAGGVVTITAPDYPPPNRTLLHVRADDVTIDGFVLVVNRPQAVAGVYAGDRNGLTVRNCVIQDSGTGGTFNNTYLPTNAVGIAVLASDDVVAESVVITNTRITINRGGSSDDTTRGIWLRWVHGEVIGNEIDALTHDALIQYSYGGATTISGNSFRGAGLEITEPDNSPISIEDNTFAPWTSNFTQSLLIDHNYRPDVTINVISNTFTGHTVGILSAASRRVLLHDNVFTPVSNATTFTHVRVNTAFEGGTPGAGEGPNAITLTNNTFHKSTAAGLNGTAIEILNDSPQSTVNFDPITIGGAPSMINTFDYGFARTVQLGANVTNTNPAINAYWNNWGRTTVENIEVTLHHQPDDSSLAKIDFYSMTIAATPPTQLADNVSPINVTATITGFFAPGSGSIVSFDTSAGTFSPALAVTNGAGQATALLTSPTAGQTTITATGGVAVNHPVRVTTIVTFTPVTNLVIGKTNDVGIVSPGDVMTYRITVTNTGLHPADNVGITDTLPDYTTFGSASDGGNETSPGSGVVTWSPFNLDGYNASATRLVTVTLDSTLLSGVATITNTAVVTDELDIYPDNNTAQDIDTVDAAPDLVLTKDDGGVMPEPGETILYTLTYTNTGHQDATGVAIAETVPEYTAFNAAASDPGWSCIDTTCTYAIGDLAVNDSGDVAFAATIVTPLPADVTEVENTATIADDSSNGADVNPDDNTATVATPVNAASDLVVSKDDRRTTVLPGETLAYLVTITNTGNQSAATVFVTDTLPVSTTFLAASDDGVESTPGVVTWPVFALAGDGERVTRLVIVTVNNPLLAGVDSITNTVTATTLNELDESDNSAWDVDTVNAAPNLTLSKNDGGVTTEPGATLVYTLTYANVGDQEATGVTITETVPAHATFDAAGSPGWSCVDTTCSCPIGDLAVGSSASVQFSVNVVTPLPAGVTQIDNTATIANDGSNGVDPTPANNTATTVTPVDASPDLSVTKSDGVDTVTPGETLIYQITVTNNGEQAATGVRVTDVLPAYTTFVAASDGGSQTTPGVVTWLTFALDGGGTSVTRFLTVTVANPFPADTNVITNTATVTDDGNNGSDPTPDNNTATDIDTIFATPNLLMTKDDGLSTVSPGSTLIYRLVITNTGNQIAAGIRLTDTLPAHTTFSLASDGGSESALGVVAWPAFDLPGGASTTRLLVVTVDTLLPAGVTAITNTAALRDNRGFTASAADIDVVDANPILVLDKTNTVTSTAPGGMLGYTLTLTNNGNQAATGVVITDALPADVIFVVASDGGFEMTPGIVAWPTFDLAGGGASVTRHLTVAVNLTLPAGLEMLINTAHAVDDRGYAATAQHADVIVAAPDLALTKDDGSSAAYPGATIVYTLTYENLGNQGATGVRIAETVPEYTTFNAAASSSGWTCLDGAPAETLCTYPVGDLAAGGSNNSAVYAVSVVTPLPFGATQIENTATLADDGSNGEDTNPDDNTATIVTPIVATPDLVISKDDQRTVAQPGDMLAYLVTITNTGNLNTAAVFVTDTLPVSTTFLAASDGGMESEPGVVTWPAFALAGDGGRTTRLVIVAVDDPLLAGVDAMTNTVTATTLNELDESDNTGQDVNTVNAAPDLALTKNDSNVTVEPGDILAYTLGYANLGNQEATGVIITETVPTHTTFDSAASSPGWTCPDTICTYTIDALAAGESDSVQFAVNVVTPLPTGVTQIDNTATITNDGSNGVDPTPTNNIASTVTPVDASPDLSVTKSDGVATVTPGETVVYQLIVTNSGNQAATGVYVTDALPAYTTFVGASDGGSQTTLGVVTWPTFELSGGAIVARTVTVAVATPFPADTNIITNTATVADDSSNGSDPTPENNTATDVDTVNAAPDLLLTKDDGLTTVSPGSTLIYRLVITNTGNQIAAGIRLTDTLPAHTTFSLASDAGQETASGSGIVTWPTFNLPGGASVTCILVVTVDTPLPAGVTAITNIAALRDNRGFTASATDIDVVDASPILVLDKTNTVTTTVPGATLNYTLTLTNNGNQAATGIIITDTLPTDVAFVAASDGGFEIVPGIVAWLVFDLPGGGASATRHLVVTVNPTLPAGLEMLINTAHAVDDRGYAATAHHADAVVAAPDLALAKDDGGSTPRPGDILAYTLSYANLGNQDATGVVIAETVPEYTTFNAAASSPGWTCLDSAPAGTRCAYSFGELAAGESDSVAFAVSVISPLPSGVRQIENSANIADDGSNGEDSNPANNIASAITTLSTTIDLVITKDDGGVTVAPSETLVYTLTYANIGDQVATGVVITETVPEYTTFNTTASSFGWTCEQGATAGTVCTYALGDVIESGVLRFAVDVVLPFPISVTEIVNHAIIGDDGTNGSDVNPDDNTATLVTPVITRPDLIASKDDGSSAVLPEQVLSYVITVVNRGTQNATNVQITDTLSAHVTFLQASDGGAQTIPGVVTWPPIAQVVLDETITRTLNVMVDGAIPAGVTHITNTVVVGDDGTHGLDLHPEDNTAIDVDAVGAMPDLVLDKTVDYAVTHPNGLIVYTIHIENTGSQGATGVGIVDQLPSNTQFISASDGGIQTTPGVVTWPLFALGVEEQATRTLTVHAIPGLPDGYVLTNTASVSDDGNNGTDPTPENNTDTVSSSIKWPVIYLPLVLRSYAIGPDLIVDNVELANNDIAITIKNQGQLPVTADLGFWVDLYINPSPAPTQVNQTWDPISPYGAAWGVDREALPILPGETRTLYLYDIYYKYNYSRLPVALRPGDILYVQVDSYNAVTTYGAILEDHEMSGSTYNNIVRTVVETYQPLNPGMMMHSLLEEPESYRLPERQ